MRDVIWVIANLIEDHSLLSLPLDCFGLRALEVFLKPVVEFLFRASLDSFSMGLHNNCGLLDFFLFFYLSFLSRF